MFQQRTQNHIFYYAIAGHPTAPPLLLLHGFLGSHQDFAGVLPALSQRFYCLVPDLPGHGQTVTGQGGYAFEAIAQALIEFIDQLALPSAYLLGYSMGGRLALYLACRFPIRFIGTVLESASPGLKTANERQLRLEKDEAIARQLETMPLSDFLTEWYKNPLFASLKHYPATYAAMLERRQHNQPLALAQVLRGCTLGHQPSLWQALPLIESPLLLLTGALDSKFVAINRDIQSMTAQAHLQTAENCGHNVHLEAPALYERYVTHFFESVPQ